MTTRSQSTHVSIVVPFTTWHDWAIDCIEACMKLRYQDFDIWALPNEQPSPEWAAKLDELELGGRLHIEPTGPANPGTKRNVALKKSSSEVFAFVDSDAWPRADWLENALPLLSSDVAIVAGPNVTPPHDPLSRKLPGIVMESLVGFGPACFRHRPIKRHVLSEMPTCNMIIKKVEGLFFREELDTSEDMAYCADVRARGFKVLYDPEVLVYHHRRSLWKPFAHQFFHYGRDKGRLLRAGSKVTYFWHSAPALFVIYLLLLPLSWLYQTSILSGLACLAPLIAYMVFITVAGITRAGLVEGFAAIPAFILAHLSYGWGFIRGAVTRPAGILK